MERELVVLTGVSGAGKSTAMGFLEDVVIIALIICRLSLWLPL